MTDESKIHDKDGKLIAVRFVENYNGGKRVITQEAFDDSLFGEQRRKIIDDRDVYPDGSEYEHKGRRLK